MKSTLTEEESQFLSEFHMPSGVGCYDKKQACVMACAVALWRHRQGELLGEETDRIECVCPVLRRMAIRLNDGNWWPDGEEQRTALMPLVPRLLNTRDEPKTFARMYRVADWAIREMLPAAIEARGFEAEAVLLRGVTPVTDKASALAACEVIRPIRKKLWGYWADAAAAAAADAAAAAAADAAAAAAADAAAAAAADAAAAAAAYWEVKIGFREKLQALIEELLAL